MQFALVILYVRMHSFSANSEARNILDVQDKLQNSIQYVVSLASGRHIYFFPLRETQT